MGSFYAELHVEGRVYPVRRFRFTAQQGTGQRGRVSEKVRQGPAWAQLDTDADDFTVLWAATPHAPKNGHFLFYHDDRQSVRETLAFTNGHLVGLSETFGPDETGEPAYYSDLTITAERFEWLPGAPANMAHVAPAPGTHGLPPAPVAAPFVRGADDSRKLVSPADVPPHLPAPQPNPSPTHRQVHLSPVEWAALIKGPGGNATRPRKRRSSRSVENTTTPNSTWPATRLSTAWAPTGKWKPFTTPARRRRTT